MSDVAESRQASKRPTWVWVISLFFFISAGYTILSYALIYSGSVPLTAGQKAYFSSLSYFDHAAAVTIAFLNITAAVLLFRLKRLAPFFFLSAFFLGLLSFSYQIAAKNWLASINGAGLLGVVIGQLLLVAIIFYAFRLRKRGVLS